MLNMFSVPVEVVVLLDGAPGPEEEGEDDEDDDDPGTQLVEAAQRTHHLQLNPSTTNKTENYIRSDCCIVGISGFSELINKCKQPDESSRTFLFFWKQNISYT